MRIDAGQRNVRGDARHEQQRQRVENARAELGDLQGVREGGKHLRKNFGFCGFRLRFSKLTMRAVGFRKSTANRKLAQPTIAWPPAFSILALADSENFAAVTLKARLSSPSPRILTVFSPPRIRPAGGQHLGVDLGDAGVERREVADVEHRDLGAMLVIVEAAVRELAVKRHLAAFETGADAAAGARGLALAAATGGLAVAAAFAAADALLAVHGTGDVLKFVEFHDGSWMGGAPPAIMRRATRIMFLEGFDLSERISSSCECSRCFPRGGAGAGR